MMLNHKHCYHKISSEKINYCQKNDVSRIDHVEVTEGCCICGKTKKYSCYGQELRDYLVREQQRESDMRILKLQANLVAAVNKLKEREKNENN